jgi:hypothetical protein
LRIISKFHDYYDVVQAQGQDQSVVWIREQKEVDLPKQDPNKHWTTNFPFPACGAATYYRWHKSHFWCDQVIIGFCGKIYPLLELSLPAHSQDDDTLCYTMEEVDAFMEANFDEKQLRGYRQTKGYHREWEHHKRRVVFQEFFEECERKQGAYEEKWFRDHRCPVFVARFRPRSESSVLLNAELKEHQFYRIFDTYSAFQELYCFMMGLAAPIEVIPKIDDVTMAEAKGFDKKWSFRKEPTKKR